MKIPHTKFCVLPWISLETSPVGTVRPCCLSKNEIMDDHGKRFMLGQANLRDIQSSNHMRELRQNFLDGVRTSDCDRCWAEEDAGRTSKRMHTLERLKHVIKEDYWTENAKPLMFLDLKLGNICNLKCRICGPWSSSSYAVEEIANDPGKNPKQSFSYQMIRQGRWPRENESFWQDIRQQIADIRYLEFTGGEPFMIQEHFDLLKTLADSGHAGNVEVHYNTNGTIYPQGAEEIWRHFKHVEVAFSIDDIGARFEYQRSGAKWEDVNRNIQLFREMRQRNANMSLQVCSTVNVFNIMYLEDLAAWIDQQDFDFVYWNMLHDGPQFCIANLPQTAKDAAKTRLSTGVFSLPHQPEIRSIIDFMYQRNGNDGRNLLDSIRKIDLRRNENLSTIAPELASAIGYQANET